MTEHIAIGAVYARAWVLFRQRFIWLILLNVLQTVGVSIGLFLREFFLAASVSPNAPSYYVLAIHPAGAYGLPVAAGALFLFASMGMVLVMDEGRTTRTSSAWGSLLRRFVPVLLAVVLCFAALGFILYGWVTLMESLSRYFASRILLLGLSLATLVLLITVSALLFATLPAAVLERGGPFKAIRRSFSLTAGQRWRIAAIIMLLLLGLVIAFMIMRIIAPPLGATLGLSSSTTVAIAIWLAYDLFLLMLSLLVMAAYQQMVRLKDGISAEDAGKVFE
ncbi:hypothetical protein AB4037_21675 [Labrys sp. KB_33_2]|uniref:hypothetical protein n=1 Tax=unclassified Labrys (in: a-proteobacteria) TaxID=2688601 RepID=UPI003EBF4C92